MFFVCSLFFSVFFVFYWKKNINMGMPPPPISPLKNTLWRCGRQAGDTDPAQTWHRLLGTDQPYIFGRSSLPTSSSVFSQWQMLSQRLWGSDLSTKGSWHKTLRTFLKSILMGWTLCLRMGDLSQRQLSILVWHSDLIPYLFFVFILSDFCPV